MLNAECHAITQICSLIERQQGELQFFAKAMQSHALPVLILKG
jgi:hypothetical protein